MRVSTDPFQSRLETATSLFATHYHELTGLAEHLPRVENVHVTADECDGEVTFLRTVAEGPTDRSYGVHVADLAGIPELVVSRARDVLDRLREEKAVEAKGSGDETRGDRTVQVVFDLGSGQFHGGSAADGGTAGAEESDASALDPATAEVIEELQETRVDETSPLDLMSKVQAWQRRLEE